MAKKEIVYDVTKHVLVPKHSKLSDKDTAEMLKLYNISSRELPKILVTDPVIQHLNVKEGDVIKIQRETQTAGATVFYRRVASA